MGDRLARGVDAEDAARLLGRVVDGGLVGGWFHARHLGMGRSAFHPSPRRVERGDWRHTVRTVPPSPTVEFVVLDEDAAELRRAVAVLAPAEHQRVLRTCHGDAAEADADPFRTPFAVVHEHEAIGFGVLDRSPLLLALLPVDPAHTVLLRAFYLDERFQGRGLGRLAIAGVAPLVQDRWPDIDTSPSPSTSRTSEPGRRTWRRASVEAGERYAGGSAGPQHVLHLTIPRRPSATG